MRLEASWLSGRRAAADHRRGVRPAGARGHALRRQPDAARAASRPARRSPTARPAWRACPATSSPARWRAARARSCSPAPRRPTTACSTAPARTSCPRARPTHVLDMDTGDYRVSTAEDQRQSAVVADAMDVVDVMWMLVAATDVPDDQRLLREYATGLSWSDKHLQDEVTDPWQVEPIIAHHGGGVRRRSTSSAAARASVSSAAPPPRSPSTAPSSTSTSSWRATAFRSSSIPCRSPGARPRSPSPGPSS